MPIEVKNLTHTYSEGNAFQSTAIQDLTVTLQDGEFIGIVGHTGCGKSTFVQHLNGLLKPTSGTVVINDVDIFGEKTDRRKVRQAVGLVFQYPEYQLFEETVAKDIAFGPKNLGLSPEEIDERVRWAMDVVHLDYDKYAERSPFELSGGQMRRVAIAGVLAMKPGVVILDEPTAGLDPRGRDRILSMIRRLHDENNTTIIMVSHSMEDMAMLADRLIVMNAGTLVAFDTPRKIFSDTKLMESIGLGVPATAKLCAILREKGIALPDSIITLEDAHQALLALWKEAHHA